MIGKKLLSVIIVVVAISIVTYSFYASEKGPLRIEPEAVEQGDYTYEEVIQLLRTTSKPVEDQAANPGAVAGCPEDRAYVDSVGEPQCSPVKERVITQKELQLLLSPAPVQGFTQEQLREMHDQEVEHQLMLMEQKQRDLEDRLRQLEWEGNTPQF